MSIDIVGVLLPTLDQQGDPRIDPAGVSFDPEHEYPIFRDFSYRIPEDLVGKGRVRRREDGALVVIGELFDNAGIDLTNPRPGDPTPKLAVSVVSVGHDSVLESSNLSSIGLVWNTMDSLQPGIERRG